MLGWYFEDSAPPLAVWRKHPQSIDTMLRHLRLPLTLLALTLTACGGGGSSAITPTGFLELTATDAPLDPELVESAEVTVELVRIHHTDEDDVESGWIEIFNGPPRTLQLSDLRNGITTLITQAELPTGAYRQVRLHLSGGELVLTNGDVFTTEDGSLDMPSSMNSSGLKVKFDTDVIIEEGKTNQVLLDFDLTKTFKPVPGNDPLNADHFKLHPVLRAVVMEGTGEVNVSVIQDDGAGTLVAIENAVVYVLEPGEVDLDEAIASSITDATGTAVILAILPGSYDVRAEKGLDAAQVDGVVVTAGSTSVIEIELP